MVHSLRVWLTMVALAIALPVCSVFAAPDDEEPVAKDEASEEFNIDESNIDQWIFNGTGGIDGARKRIKSRLQAQLDELQRVCNLTDVQKQKLNLAARGDTKHFFDEVEEVRQKFLAVKNDRDAFNGIWQHIQPVQRKLAVGLFGEKSFFVKSLSKTLSAEQMVQYQAVVEQRRRYRYQASIETAVTMLQNSVPLRNDQYAALVKLIIEETQPPIAFGQYDYYVVMQQLSKLPEDKVKSLVDEHQWKLLQQQFAQFRGMGPFLIQNGLIIQEGNEDAGNEDTVGAPEIDF